MVEITIKIWRETEDEKDADLAFGASTWADKDNLYAGYGDTPFNAMRDLINDLENREFFRED